MLHVFRGAGLIEMAFPATLDNIDRAVEEARSFLTECELEGYRFDVLLILREALTNAVLHGSRENPALRVDCSLRLEGDLLRLEVQDQGDGFDWVKVLANDLEPSAGADRGRGLLILKRYGTEVGFNEKGNRMFLLIQCGERAVRDEGRDTASQGRPDGS